MNPLVEPAGLACAGCVGFTFCMHNEVFSISTKTNLHIDRLIILRMFVTIN